MVGESQELYADQPDSYVTVLVTMIWQHCGSKIKPRRKFSNYEGAVPCMMKCHKGTWVSIASGRIRALKKWPLQGPELQYQVIQS